MSLVPEELLFTAASGFDDAGEQQAFLDYACGNNLPLRTRLQEMLAVQEQATAFFAFRPADEPVAKPTENELNATIGPYRLVSQIGAGGGGVVYLAEQEEPVRRKVALKILKLGMDTRAIIARFELERRALAQMDHPNIARVLDAGMTGSGRPYFVMELVEGKRITEFCDLNQMKVRQRLELFVQVCRAVQHAHQKGIIHRDLKPSNILVGVQDDGPVPKIIDFGIAKATEQTQTDGETLTQLGHLLGTPLYMSPEQARGGADVDTRSDIYSLGVLLYELLSGKTPFSSQQFASGAPEEIRRIMREEEPARPSVAVKMAAAVERDEVAANRGLGAPDLLALLAGDLDWIVMKAIEKERSLRYDTATGLASDVLRHLSDEVVIARPPNRLYGFQKFVRRNRTMIAAGGAILLALVLGLGVSTWQMIKANRAMKRAEAAEQQQLRLRLQAEDRQRFKQAALAINQSRFAEAEEIVSTALSFPPSLETESVLRGLGEWHVLNGRWDEGAKRFGQLLETDQIDQSEAITTDLLLAGPLQIERNDLAGYEHFRRVAIARFSGTTNPIDAERTIKISLLLPAGPEISKDLERLAALAAHSVPEQDKISDEMVAWRRMSLGLMAYRQGQTSAAQDWSRKALTYLSKDASARRVNANLILAMSLHQQGEGEEADKALSWSREVVADRFSAGLKAGDSRRGYWYDWLFARILLREADILIKDAAADAPEIKP